MLRRSTHVFAGIAFLTVALAAQHTHSQYAGEQRRDIKALSEKEIASYLAGEGMGFAKSAELNSYPGPRHVLEAADPLELSAGQRAATRQAFHEMQAEARRLGATIVAKETELERAFRNRTADDTTVRGLVEEIARLQGELRFAHLRAHLQVTALLSPAQVKKYDELRGYSTPGASAEHKH